MVDIVTFADKIDNATTTAATRVTHQHQPRQVPQPSLIQRTIDHSVHS